MKAGTGGLKYVLLFTAFSSADALTTWLGTRRGFAEANPVLAERLSSPLLFFGSFALFTLLGVVVIVLSLHLTKRVPAMGYFLDLFVALKALPVLNNVFVLAGLSPLELTVMTTAQWLLGFT
ncbi:DUF5658 family protein [Thermococcus zilligii]|uniref:DUF5658 family protein n=1 Tax=Thermococcus zilligii TaxID=54076 RepID=UPI00029A21D6|nr:DUF5658 family protein [Thermococcus zilligii]